MTDDMNGAQTADDNVCFEDVNLSKPLHDDDVEENDIIVEISSPFREPTQTFTLFGWTDTTTRTVIGLLLVVLLAFAWVAGTQFAKSTYSKTFNAPFFTTWFTTNFMIVVFPLFAIPQFFQKKPQRAKRFIRDSSLIYGPQGVCVFSILKYNLSFCFLWVLTNYLYIRALGVISAADVTALFSSSNAFVYIFSLIWLKESFFLTRVLAVTLSIIGIILFALADGFSGPTEVGVILSVVAALGAAFYKVFYKKLVGNASGSQVALFLSLLGVCNLILGSIVVVILHFTSYEYLGDSIPWLTLFITGLLVLVFNFVLNFGIALTFPLFISLGTVLGIPLNALTDAVFRDTSFGTMKIIATVLIVFGFLLMLISNERLAKFEYIAWVPYVTGICRKQRKREAKYETALRNNPVDETTEMAAIN